jgi:hypothetical protein
MVSKGFGDGEPLDLGMRIAGAVAEAELFPAGDVGGEAQHGEAILLRARIRFAGAIPFQHGEFRRVQVGALAIAEGAGEVEDPRLPGSEQFLRRELGRGMEIERAALAGRRPQLRREGMQVRFVAGRNRKRAALDLAKSLGLEVLAEAVLDAIARQQQRPTVLMNMRRPPGGRRHFLNLGAAISGFFYCADVPTANAPRLRLAQAAGPAMSRRPIP